MQTLYAACDATLVPSVYLDPFPTVCLESMACARPVIATIHGGAKEAVNDGVTGWLVDPLHEEAFTDRLRWCITHRSELPEFGEAARKHIEEHFSMEKYVDAVLEIYTK